MVVKDACLPVKAFHLEFYGFGGENFTAFEVVLQKVKIENRPVLLHYTRNFHGHTSNYELKLHFQGVFD